MATLLEPHIVRDALHRLEGWTYDNDRLTRTVSLEERQRATVEGKVGEVADAMDHHPTVSHDGERLTFAVWTHSAGGVTELDIALASVIDDAVRHATGAPPTPVPQELAGTHAVTDGDSGEAGDRPEPAP